MWREETSSKRQRVIQLSGNDLNMRSRLATPSLSNSMINTNISNYNRRLRSSNKGIEELKLWGIAKEIGLVCHECEESIIQRFPKMEERDNLDLREASCDDGNQLL